MEVDNHLSSQAALNLSQSYPLGASLYTDSSFNCQSLTHHQSDDESSSEMSYSTRNVTPGGESIPTGDVGSYLRNSNDRETSDVAATCNEEVINGNELLKKEKNVQHDVNVNKKMVQQTSFRYYKEAEANNSTNHNEINGDDDDDDDKDDVEPSTTSSTFAYHAANNTAALTQTALNYLYNSRMYSLCTQNRDNVYTPDGVGVTSNGHVSSSGEDNCSRSPTRSESPQMGQNPHN